MRITPPYPVRRAPPRPGRRPDDEPPGTPGRRRLRRRDPDTPDVAYACTTGDPRIADVLLRDIQPDDLLRVTGTVVQPDTPGASAQITVDALEVLHAAPAPVPYDLMIERWGNYATVFDADRDTVPVFTVDGKWVGEAANHDSISDLIDAFENGGAP
ncbi:hypothetical protein GCM10010425_12670 [Streptomyces spororaveus]|uniref:Uncharacterized protein n=1 Tax=Streptomyces spororaveus TaxID=284039 RepID=A0ABQ3T4U7_9ACTN|nr:hypothetical protein [Streptomyces spororaveus]GHI75418.1 hypothetical protein Sspor_09790 [Streptomyces spororaveus]